MTISDKYPRTLHLPFSPGRSEDDKVLDTVEHLLDRHLVVLEKVDGGNACFVNSGVYARTHGSIAKHPAFGPVKAIWASVRHQIPDGWSIFGEACYAKHSIAYNALPSFFLVFGIRLDVDNTWLSWANVKKHCKILGLETVPELWTGWVENEKDLRHIVTESLALGSVCGGEDIEGIVIRDANHFSSFQDSVAKWVRESHVKTSNHWDKQPIVPNRLKTSVDNT